MGVLQLTEQGIDDDPGGVVNRQQQWNCGPSQPSGAAVYLDITRHVPPNPVFPGRRLRGLFTPALVSILRNVSRPMSIPSRSLSNSLRCVWLTPAYRVRARRTASIASVLGVTLRAVAVSYWAAPFSMPPVCAWYGVRSVPSVSLPAQLQPVSC